MIWLRLFVGVSGAVALAAAAVAVGCAGQGEGADDASIDYLGVQVEPEGGDDAATADTGSGLATTLRLANLSPDLGSVDFCWRTSGAAAFNGPVLGSAPGPDAGSDGGSRDAASDRAVDAIGDGEGGGASDSGGRADGSGDATLDSPADAPLDGPKDARAEGSAEGGLDAAQDAPSDARKDAADAAGEAEGGLSDGAPPAGLDFGRVSAEVTLPAAGTFDLALVTAGTLSCAAPRFIGRVTLDAGKTGTVVLLGLAGAPPDASGDAAASTLAMTAFVDEPTSPGVAGVRFIHAALGWPGGPPAPGALTVSSGGVTLAPEVLPGKATSAMLSPAVDTLGYLDVTPIVAPAPFVLSSLVDAGPRQTWTTPFLLPGVLPGTSHTGFVVSFVGGALGVVWCGDVGSSPGLPSSCVMLPAP